VYLKGKNGSFGPRDHLYMVSWRLGKHKPVGWPMEQAGMKGGMPLCLAGKDLLSFPSDEGFILRASSITPLAVLVKGRKKNRGKGENFINP